MKRYNYYLFILSVIVLLGCNSRQAVEVEDNSSQYFNQRWAEKPIWDDGQAEVAKYQATRVVYGKPRSYQYTFILVKEIFNEEFQVKTDDYSRNDLFPVMKVNQFCSFETKAYPYHYLTSIFFKQDNARQVHKLSNTSQEWCGNTAKSFLAKDDHYLFEYMSYWDGQGNGSMKINNSPLFEDQLSYSLRALKFADGLSFETMIYPSQINSKASKPKAVKSIINVTKSGLNEVNEVNQAMVETPWKVEVLKSDGESLAFWFNSTYPNALLKMQASDGRSLQLDSLYRDAYWNHE